MTRAAERGSLQALALGAPNVRAAMGLGRPARGREFAHRLFGRQPLTGEVAEPDLAHAVLPRRLPPPNNFTRACGTRRASMANASGFSLFSSSNSLLAFTYSSIAAAIRVVSSAGLADTSAGAGC